jgi:hypothetical protein
VFRPLLSRTTQHEVDTPAARDELACLVHNIYTQFHARKPTSSVDADLPDGSHREFTRGIPLSKVQETARIQFEPNAFDERRLRVRSRAVTRSPPPNHEIPHAMSFNLRGEPIVRDSHNHQGCYATTQARHLQGPANWGVDPGSVTDDSALRLQRGRLQDPATFPPRALEILGDLLPDLLPTKLFQSASTPARSSLRNMARPATTSTTRTEVEVLTGVGVTSRAPVLGSVVLATRRALAGLSRLEVPRTAAGPIAAGVDQRDPGTQLVLELVAHLPPDSVCESGGDLCVAIHGDDGLTVPVEPVRPGPAVVVCNPGQADDQVMCVFFGHTRRVPPRLHAGRV